MIREDMNPVFFVKKIMEKIYANQGKSIMINP